jgi:hypothetical protein
MVSQAFFDLSNVDLSVGFTGVYYVDESDSGKVHTLASSYASVGSKGDYQYDLDLASVKSLVSKAYSDEASTSSTTQVSKEYLEMYAVRADVSFRLDDNNVETIAPEFYPQLYFVRGVSITQWDSLLQKELALSLSSFFIRAASMVFTCWMLYHPIRKFISQLDASVIRVYQEKSKKFRKASSSSGSRGAGNIVLNMIQDFKSSSQNSMAESSNQVNTRVEVVPMQTS